jgi:hypothetical protein
MHRDTSSDSAGTGLYPRPDDHGAPAQGAPWRRRRRAARLVAALVIATLGAGTASAIPKKPTADAPPPPTDTAPPATVTPNPGDAPATSTPPPGNAAVAEGKEPLARSPIDRPTGGFSRFGGPSRSGAAPTSDFLPISDRWRIGVPPENRFSTERGAYGGGGAPGLFEPYKQNVLKGDYPLPGTQDLFLILNLTSDTLFEARRLPTPSGVSTATADSLEFFGGGRQYLINQNFILSMELFEGDTVYKPRDWEFRFTPVINYNFVSTQELGVISPNVDNGQDRHDEWVGIQELFYEKHLLDLSVNYDIMAVRLGIQGFQSDFRGFLFSDNEPGVRLFGTYDNNKTQWNLAYFTQLEKDTNSGLNDYQLRDQQVLIGNVYAQDFLGLLGYTAQASIHVNLDSGQDQIDKNGVIARPAPIGTVHPNSINAYYLGWAGDGHIGRFNLTHQYYWALGSESFNAIAGRPVDINAHFAAVELSYDQDWIRYRASFLYASGDSDPFDGKATGFDTIFDNPNFAGGGTSLFTRQAIRLTGAGVALTQRNSIVPDLRTSKEQGQANFVNPGLFMYNLGVDFDVTPRLKVISNLTWLTFDDTGVIREVLHDNKIGHDIGLDYSLGVQWRPFLNNNAIINFGAAALTPGQGFKDIYTSQTLYSVFLGVTLSY